MDNNMDFASMTEEEKREREKELWNELKALRSTMLRSDWHAGFESVLRLDTYDYGAGVQIKVEEILGEEPPRADFIVLVEDANIHLDKEIFKIFRRHNVIEYKAKQDDLNERTLRKVVGYANFYIGMAAHEGDVPSDDVTLSVFREVKNPQLFKEMMDAGTLVADGTKGIYHVKGYTDLPYQIVITSELEGDEYAAYRALSAKATETDVETVMTIGKAETDDVKRRYFRALLGLVAEKNPDLVAEIRRRDEAMATTWQDIFKEDIDKKVVEGEQRTWVKAIRNLKESAGVSVDKAMDMLMVPKESRSVLRTML